MHARRIVSKWKCTIPKQITKFNQESKHRYKSKSLWIIAHSLLGDTYRLGREKGGQQGRRRNGTNFLNLQELFELCCVRLLPQRSLPFPRDHQRVLLQSMKKLILGNLHGGHIFRRKVDPTPSYYRS